MNCFDVIHYPTMAREAAIDLWEQGIRSDDPTIIQLCYGYFEEETACICKQLKLIEQNPAIAQIGYDPRIEF